MTTRLRSTRLITNISNIHGIPLRLAPSRGGLVPSRPFHSGHMSNAGLRSPVPRKVDPRATPKWDEILPPTVIFQTATKSGFITFDRNIAASVVNDLYNLDRSVALSKGAGETVCAKYKLESSDLTMLAQLFLRSPRQQHAQPTPSLPSLALQLLTIASAMGDPAGLVRLASIRLRGVSAVPYNSTEYKIQIDRMEALARKGVVEAALLLAQTLTENGEVAKSLAWWQQAGEGGSGYAWGELGKLMERAGNMVKAKEAYEKGAAENDAESHWRASQLESSGQFNHEKPPEALLKAAASGVPQAAQALGVFYGKQETEIGRMMATEWLAVGEPAKQA